MGQIFRSEDMHLVQVFIQAEAAHDSVEQLGRLNDGEGLIEFEDLNPDVNAFKKKFVNEVKRCEEMDRKLRFFAEQVAGAKITPEESAGASLQYGGGVSPGSNSTARMDALDSAFTETEQKLLRANENQSVLDKSYIQLVDIRHILLKTADFFDEAPMEFTDQPADVGNDGGEKQGLLAGGSTSEATGTTSYPKAIKLGFVTGLIERQKLATFERILWRATRGNFVMRQSEIEQKLRDPISGEETEKNVFIIFFQGERLNFKITKICESLGVSVYPCPDTPAERHDLLKEVNQRLHDLNDVISRTYKTRRKDLIEIAQQLAGWQEIVRTEKAIYHTLNLFKADVTKNVLIAEGWTPLWADEQIQGALDLAKKTSGATNRSVFYDKASKADPPTYFRTNDFIWGFQSIVDNYGMARYKEVNPAPFTVITFPFFFGIMFGDIGHGLLLLLLALWMVYYNRVTPKEQQSETMRGAMKGRYVLLMMGLFAMYAGVLYNDVFALMIGPFESNWVEVSEGEFEHTPGSVYPIGVDWAWSGASNKMQMMNSIKMKLSIILGVTQMLLGVVLSAFNNVHFNKKLNIVCETIPQIIFLMALFGYMVALIIGKWLTDWTVPGMISPPLILSTIIDMLLSFSQPIAEDVLLYEGQHSLQIFLVILMLVAVPWMLFPKPIILWRRHKAAMLYKEVHQHNPDAEDEEEDEEEEFELGEIVTHQIIHTIEYVLGTVSNTASYLRLWALSLAHAELSEVFWEQVFFMVLKMPSHNPVLVYCAMAAWAAATVAVLLVMEQLSAFLHALRLHWVEFQNKFYVGDGRRFQPFGLAALPSDE